MGRRPFIGEEKELSESKKLQRMRDYGKKFRGIQRGIRLYKRLAERRKSNRIQNAKELFKSLFEADGGGKAFPLQKQG